MEKLGLKQPEGCGKARATRKRSPEAGLEPRPSLKGTSFSPSVLSEGLCSSGCCFQFELISELQSESDAASVV